MKTKEVTFKEFAKHYKEFYQCNKVFIKDYSDAEDVVYDLYDTLHFDFDYERRVLELYY